MDTNQTETAETQQPAGENSQPAANQDKPQFVPPASQKALDKIIEQRIARERATAVLDDFKATLQLHEHGTAKHLQYFLKKVRRPSNRTKASHTTGPSKYLSLENYSISCGILP